MVAAVRFPVPLRIYAFIDEQALVDHGGVQLAALQRQPRLLESHVAQFRRRGVSPASAALSIRRPDFEPQIR